MGLLNFFSKPGSVSLVRLPSGSFTLDRNGQLVVSTLPSSFPREILDDMGRAVLDSFAEARKAGLELERLVLQFGSLKVSARDLAGGAIVFLSPQTPLSVNSSH
jgi:hypothetical protein